MSNRMLHIARMAYHELVREGATIQAHLADIFVDEVVVGVHSVEGSPHS